MDSKNKLTEEVLVATGQYKQEIRKSSIGMYKSKIHMKIYYLVLQLLNLVNGVNAITEKRSRGQLNTLLPIISSKLFTHLTVLPSLQFLPIGQGWSSLAAFTELKKSESINMSESIELAHCSQHM
jgi:hypothetical protein